MGAIGQTDGMRLSFWAGPGQPWPEILAACQRAEASGWDGIWVADHFMPLDTGYGDGDPGGADVELGPVHEAWTMLGALAAVVPRVRLGAMVTGNTYRHPAVLAKMAATVDHISNGRLVLGLGAAWQENEHRRYGIPLGSAKERSDRLEEACQVITALLSPARRSTVNGRYYCLDEAPLEPKPVQSHLPLLIGGAGERRTLRTVARYADEWNAWGPPELIAAKMAVLDQHCRDEGRDPAAIQRSAAAMLWVAATEDEAARLTGPMAHRGGLVGTPEQLRRRLDDYAAAGIQELVVPDFNLGSRRDEMLDAFFDIARR